MDRPEASSWPLSRLPPSELRRRAAGRACPTEGRPIDFGERNRHVALDNATSALPYLDSEPEHTHRRRTLTARTNGNVFGKTRFHSHGCGWWKHESGGRARVIY